jgi:hypothetical protein
MTVPTVSVQSLEVDDKETGDEEVGVTMGRVGVAEVESSIDVVRLGRVRIGVELALVEERRVVLLPGIELRQDCQWVLVVVGLGLRLVLLVLLLEALPEDAVLGAYDSEEELDGKMGVVDE